MEHILEFKIFMYWLLLWMLMYVVSHIDHHFNGGTLWYKYSDRFSVGLYHVIKFIGFIVIVFWLFMQFTNYFFKGVFILIN